MVRRCFIKLRIKRGRWDKPTASFFVRLIRLELTRLAALDPKSSVSTNSTTGAFLVKTAQRYNFLAKLETKSSKKFYFGLSPDPSPRRGER